MSEQANYFKLGVFVITAFTLLVLGLALLGAGDFLKREILVETCFNETVQGLDVGSPVKYRGIEIGKVKTITGASRIYDIRTDYVLVIISLFEDISLGQTGDTTEERIRQALADGLTVQMAFKGLTGAAYLETGYMDKTETAPLEIAWTPKHPYIPSHPNKITQMGESLDRIMKNLETINIQGLVVKLQDLLSLTGEKLGEADVKEISFQAATLLKEVRQTNQKLDGFFASTRTRELMDDARATMAGARTIVEQARNPIEETLKEFRQAAAATSHTAGSLNTTSRLVDEMMWVNAGSIKEMVENLKTASENLKQMSQDLKRYPGRLLFDKPPGKKEEK
ncbi:MAG: MCE family protein [Desulfobacteraceae bacterium]|nr:MCE family protein [Desulfobacteraceae bacterium]